MINVKLIRKKRSSQSSGAASSGSRYSGGARSTDYATESGHAKEADHSAKSDLASRAYNADESTHAASAASLDETSTVWDKLKKTFLSKTDDDTASGLITFLKGVVVKGTSVLEKLTVSAKALFQDNVEMDKDLEVKGTANVDGDLTAKGNTTIGKDASVNGSVIADDIHSGNFADSTDLMSGKGFHVWVDGNTSNAVLDNLSVRGRMRTAIMEIMKLQFSAGNITIDGAGAELFAVKAFNTNGNAIDGTASAADTDFYRCYFKATDGEKNVDNEWHVGDIARCQTFNLTDGTFENSANRLYARVVIGVDAAPEEINGSKCHYVDLSNNSTFKTTNIDGKDVPYIGLLHTELGKPSSVVSNDAPLAGDNIAHVGNIADTERQGAVQLVAVGTDKGLLIYDGINEALESLADFARIKLSPKDSFINTSFITFTNGYHESSPYIICGDWLTGTKAHASEVWQHNGASWICNSDTDTEPGENNPAWKPLASKGDPGETGPQGPAAEAFYVNPSAVIVTEQLNLSDKDTEEQRNNKYTDKDFSYIIPSTLAIHHSVGSEDVIVKVPDGGWSCTEGTALLSDNWTTALQNSFKAGTGYDLTSILTKDKLSSNSSIIKITLVAAISSVIKLNIAVYINRLGTVQSATYGDTTETVRKKVVNEVSDSITKAQHTADAAQKTANAAVKTTDFEAYIKATAEQFSQIYTKSETDSQISSKVEQSAESIKLSVASKKTYRNILQLTDFKQFDESVLQIHPNVGNKAELDSTQFDGTNAIHFVLTQANEYPYTSVVFHPVKVEAGKKYHLSVIAKGKGTLTVAAFYLNTDGSNTWKNVKAVDQFTLKDDWQLYHSNYTIDSSYSLIEIVLYSNIADDDLYIARPMLEEGTEYTGWTLSPEDPTIEDKLVETGIDIENGKIEAKTGRFDFLGLDGNPYIRVEQDEQGMPHFIFYNRAGTPMYDLGYTGSFDLIEGSDKQSWVKYIGIAAKGNTIACKTLAGSFAFKSGAIVDIAPIFPTIYEYHSAKFVDGAGKTVYYHGDNNYSLYDSDAVDSSNNNAPTGTKVFTNNLTSGYLYETAMAVDNSTASTKITTYTFFAHHILMDAVNDANGRYKNDFIKIEVEKSGVQVGNDVSASYRWRVNGGNWTVSDTVEIS